MKIKVLSSGGKREVVGKVVEYEENVLPAEIIATDYLDLGETYKVLPKVRAVIVTQGGILSHLAILGREFGVPVIRIDKEDVKNVLGKKIRIDLENKKIELMEGG